MEKKNSQNNYENNYINNIDQQDIKNDYGQFGKVVYYQSKQNNRNIIDNPKVIQNKNNSSNSTIYSSYQQNKQILKNIIPNNLNNKNKNDYQLPIKSYEIKQSQLNQDLSMSIQKSFQSYQISNNQFNILQKSKDDLSFCSQNPLQSYDKTLNNKSFNDTSLNKSNNKNINNIKVIKNTNISNIVNIDNQSSAIELSFIAKKPKKNYKISSIIQVGTNQTPIGFSFIAEKPNKYMNNNNNILNESNGQNISFISSKQIDLNDLNQFPKQEISLSVSKSNNNLKIMTNNQINNGQKNNCNQSKPKPILQIVSKNNNYNKKLQDNLLPQHQINGFSIDNKNKDLNEIPKNNFIYNSKIGNEIFNNYNQDLSFISNSKETENLFEINGININDYKVNYFNSGNISPPKDKQLFNINNGLSSSQQSANNKNNNYIMINNQFCYISSIIRNKNLYEYTQQDLNCSLPKKRIKIEYYDIQPVSFNLISIIKREEEIKKKYENEFKNNYKKKKLNYIAERVNQIQFRPYKVFRAVEIEYIINCDVKKEEKKELEIEQDEDILEKSFNNKGNKKRKRRRKK